MSHDFLCRMSGVESSFSESILKHIQFLMNTRKGSLVHMMDYGLPEYAPHQNHFEIKQAFTMALKEAIERYEPRIRALNVQETRLDGNNCIVHVTLKASLMCREQLNFDALLLSGGEVLIR